MTDRITHDEARRLLELEPHAFGLQRYIDQQEKLDSGRTDTTELPDSEDGTTLAYLHEQEVVK